MSRISSGDGATPKGEMNENVVEFPNRRSLREEAAEWLVRLDGDEPLSPARRDALRAWLARGPAHRKELKDLAALWDRLNVLTELEAPPQQAGWRERLGFSKPRGWLLAFGAVTVAAAVAVFLFDVRPALEMAPRDPLLASNGLYATAVGQQQTTALADGSTVLLNTDSQIRVEYDADFRSIRLLRGEAHFTVAENAGRPFRVYAGTSRVQAVGTAFSVYLKTDSVDVTVTEGRVALASIDAARGSDPRPPDIAPATGAARDMAGGVRYIENPRSLSAGEGATIRGAGPDGGNAANTGGADLVEITDDISRRLTWREGVLTFAGEPLDSVVAEINRYTTVSIVVEDPDIRAIRIGGRFPIGETDAMLEALEASFGLRVTWLDHDRVRVSADSF